MSGKTRGTKKANRNKGSPLRSRSRSRSPNRIPLAHDILSSLSSSSVPTQEAARYMHDFKYRGLIERAFRDYANTKDPDKFYKIRGLLENYGYDDYVLHKDNYEEILKELGASKKIKKTKRKKGKKGKKGKK